MSEEDPNQRLIRKRAGLITAMLVLISLVGTAQSLAVQRDILLDSINYFREDPVRRVKDVFGITLDENRYKPMPSYILNKKLSKSAQKWAERMARTGKYHHSRTKYNESIDAIMGWQGGYELSVGRFIIDEYVPNAGHRRHLLSWADELIGIGIAMTETGDTYICIQTTTSN